LQVRPFFSHLHKKRKALIYRASEAATHRKKFDRRASLLLSLVRWENITAPTLRAGSRFLFGHLGSPPVRFSTSFSTIIATACG
jgi:hypothetical protein